jgi:excisionase family DNA binding protein
MPTPSRPRMGTPGMPTGRFPEVLDVHLTAQFLTVSADTVYDLLQRGDLPGRKVGRKWLTTKTAVLKWLEQSTTPWTRAAQETALARHCPRRHGRAGGRRADRQSAARDEG